MGREGVVWGLPSSLSLLPPRSLFRAGHWGAPKALDGDGEGKRKEMERGGRSREEKGEKKDRRTDGTARWHWS